MAEAFDKKIVIADEDGEFLTEAKSILDGRAPTVESLADVQRLLEHGLDLVVLGPSFAHGSALKSAGVLKELDSEVEVVLVAGAVTAQLLRAAMRSGLRDVLEAPLTEQKLLEVMSRIEHRARRTTEVEPFGIPEQSVGKVIAVMSAKGGSGKSVVATNLAMLLTRDHKPEGTVLVDGDLQFGDVDLMLQLKKPARTIVDAAKDLDRLDVSLMESMLTKHPSGLRVLAAPWEPAFADEISTQSLTEIVSLLRSMFDFVIVDTASLLDELLLSLLERADQVLMVVDMDYPSIRNARKALDTLRLLKFPIGKVEIVVNRSNATNKTGSKEIEQTLGLPVAAEIPSDRRVPMSVDQGRPIVDSEPRSAVAKGFESVAALVASSASGRRKRGR